MGAIAYRLRSEARRRWKSWCALAILVGVAGGGVLALVAGARRTATAYESLERRFGYQVAFMGAAGHAPTVPGVAHLLELTGFTAVVMLDAAGEPIDVEDYYEPMVTPVAASALGKLVEGRSLDPGNPDEAVAHFTLAETFGLEIGDRVTLPLLSSEEVARVEGGDFDFVFGPHGHAVTVDIVGIVAVPGEFPPRADGAGAGPLFLSPALLRELPGDVDRRAVTLVRTTPGVDPAAVRARLVDAGIPAGTTEVAGGATQRAIDVQVGALVVLAVLVGGTLWLVVGQALARYNQAQLDSSLLAALGMGPRARVLLVLARTALIATAGTMLAVGLAIVCSPLFPAGLARTAEVDPGVTADAGVLVIGVVAIPLGLAIACSAVARRAGQRAAGDREGRLDRRPTPAARLAAAGLPVVGAVGMRFALERGRGRSAVPVASTIASAAIGIAAVVGTITFVASQEHLGKSPSLYGFTWDAQTGDGFGTDDVSDDLEFLDDDPGASAYALGTIAVVTVNGHDTNMYAFTSRKGLVTPTLLDGRPPAGDREAVLARDTMRRAGARVGDEVTLRLADPEQGSEERRFVVVGEGVVPEVSGLAEAALGEGAWLTFEGFTSLAHPGAAVRNVGLIDLAEGAPGQRTAEALDEADDRPPKPTEIENFARVSYLPVVIAGFMALLCGSLLVHAVASAVRARRRDLALLKAVGLLRRQVAAITAWQASTTILAALALGVPMGVVAGRLAWRVTATDLGVPVVPVVPALAVLAVTLAALVVANGAALAPGVRASRQRPAAALRTE